MDEITPLRVTAARAPFSLPKEASPPGVDEPRPPGWLTADEAKEVQQLRQADGEVRRRERDRGLDAEASPRVDSDYEYRLGPDGRRYAVHTRPGLVVADAPGTEQTGTPRRDPGSDNRKEGPKLDITI